MEWKLDQAQDNHGMIAERTFNLAEEKPRKFLISPNFLRYTNISVEIVCEGATATSGNVTIHETNNSQGGNNGNYTTASVVALGVNSETYTKVNDILSRYIALEFPGTVGVVGKITVRIVGKQGV